MGEVWLGWDIRLDRDVAVKFLKALKADLTRMHGPEHPTVGQVRDLLDSIQRRPG